MIIKPYIFFGDRTKLFTKVLNERAFLGKMSAKGALLGQSFYVLPKRVCVGSITD